MNLVRRISFLLATALTAVLGMSLMVTPSAHAQATISTGGFSGVILDPKGGYVTAASLTLTSKETGAKQESTSGAAGDFTYANLAPGVYVFRVSITGFKTREQSVTVQVGQVTSLNVTLEIGDSTTVVEVQSNTETVNLDQVSVSGVLTEQQIEQLPINGRNFLDLAQLEPGVQIQDGNNFDPTKVGYSSISFGSRFGRTARVNVDGVDVSDETVGTVTTNIPSSALQEFQISSSSLDLSNDITSSGAVNVVTKSGTNSFHGEAFDYFRDNSTAAAIPRATSQVNPFQRSQFGGDFGGAIIKDKLFFFMDAERTMNHLAAPITLSDPFADDGSHYNAPYKETDLLGKLDYVATPNLKFFSRYDYFDNYAVSEFQSVGLNPYLSKNYTHTVVVGADYTHGSWTHSFRFEYLKFENQILDATLMSGLPFSTGGASLQVGSLNAGPSFLAPQETPQSDHDYKYDGSKILGKHVLRFGASLNHIQGGGFAKFFSINPLLINIADPASVAFANTNPFAPGGDTNPLNYPLQEAIIGNGLGFSTEKPAFGFPFGGLGPDNRLGLYLGDTWKIKTNLTLIAGLRYDRDTGRTDSDLNPPGFEAAVDSFFPGFGAPVRQPNLNFGPQAGIAWDPFKDGKTVIRAGIGLYYENVIYNSVLFDRPLRLSQGGFLSDPAPCIFGSAIPIPFGDGTTQTINPAVCNDTIGAAAPLIDAFQAAYQASFPKNAIEPNPNYLPTLLAGGTSAIPTGFFAPNYQSPRSLQMNVGFQRQLWSGTVLSVDYVRNVATHYALGYDVNHVGDTRYFNLPAAQAAITRTNASFGCPAGPAGINCAIAAGASISDYATNGLSTPTDAGVSICDAATTGYQCAFGGVNPNSPAFPVQEPIGRAVYNGLQVKYVQNIAHPTPGIKNLSLQLSYALSNFSDDGGQVGSGSQISASDQDFVNNALDYANPARYYGPAGLNRKNQFSFGGVIDVPHGFQIGLVGHFYSPLPVTLYSVTSGAPGEIFKTDFSGDGTTGDPLPNTTIGAYGNSITSISQLTAVLNNYNTNVANQPTPAGQELISNGLFSLSQLQALGGVAPSIPLPGPGQVGTYGLKDVDFKLSYIYKVKERLTIQPSMGVYNVFNFANYDGAGGLISGVLNGQQGSLNGTNYAGQAGQRTGVGTGVFALGAPRVFEWGLKFSF
jgi:hypothetical protein